MLANPATALTDYGLALEAIGFALGLCWPLFPSPSQFQGQPRRVPYFWVAAFLSVGLAAALGGTVHGFPNLSPGVQIRLWQGIGVGLGLTSFCAIQGVAHEVLGGRSRHWLGAIAGLKLVLLLTLGITHPSFALGVLDYLLSIGIVLGVRLGHGHRYPAAVLSWTKVGVGLSAIALLPLLFPTLPHWISPEVQYHLIQMLALLGFFQAVRIQVRKGRIP